MAITKVISGGQIGADIGGLDAAVYCDLPHGGWCPKGRKQEKRRKVRAKSALKEMPTGDYPKRTEANVVDSDATVVFTYGPVTGGSKLTVELARKHGKPCLHVDLDALSREECVEAVVRWVVVRWVNEECPADCVLNVTGSRESKAEGIEELVQAIMVDVLRAVNPECRKFYTLSV